MYIYIYVYTHLFILALYRESILRTYREHFIVCFGMCTVPPPFDGKFQQWLEFKEKGLIQTLSVVISFMLNKFPSCAT